MDTNAYAHVLDSALAENTRIAYQRGWQCFADFCAAKNYTPFPTTPQTMVEFLITQAIEPVSASGKPLAMGTVVLYCNAINHKHTDAGLVSPARDPQVVNVLRGLRRLKGTAPRQVKALRENHIQSMLRVCGKTRLGMRNAAIIAIGFAAALRRSEICNLKVEDVEIIDAADGSRAARMFIHIRKSKTDQQSKGQKIAVPEGARIKPIQRVRDWLKASGTSSGYLFQTMRRGGVLMGKKLHDTDVPRIVKHYAALIGLDAREIAGHSLRAGFVTSAAAHNARLDKIMEVTRHRNPATVLKYIRDADVFSNHAGERFL